MSAWQKTKHGSKATFDKAWHAFEKLGGPVNKLTNKIGSEAFWPTSLGPESDKAARILKSFCKDGFYKDEPASSTSSGPKNKPKVLVKIPQKVIQNCVGLAIFSVMRTGLWISGAGGSGVLIARTEDGGWSPPSGILIHTLGVGFMAGIDIYDCVIVINSREALQAFSKLRVSLGGELSVVAGPIGAGGILESELTKDRKPVWSYVKSRGLYGGLQIDGTVIVERDDENANFYGERIPIGEILAGHVKRIPPATHMLMEVVKQAEGRTDVDQVVLEQAAHLPSPGDVDIEKMSIPTQDEKNSYGPPSNYQPTEGYGASQSPGEGIPPSFYYANELGPGAAQMYHPPPGAPPMRTDSGFAAPPPRSPRRPNAESPVPAQPTTTHGKNDPDGPPRYA